MSYKPNTAMAENVGVFVADEHIQTEEDETPLAPTYTLPDGRVICLDFNVTMTTWLMSQVVNQ